MRGFSAAVLGVITIVTVAVMWVPGKWPTSIPEVSMCVLAALWGIRAAAGKGPVKPAWVLAPLAGVVLLAVLQIATGSTVYSWLTRMAALYWAGNFATFFIASQIFADRDWRVRYLDALLLFGTALAVLSTTEYIFSPMKIFWIYPVERPGYGPFLYNNQYAAFMELLLPLAVWGALTSEKNRFFRILAAAIIFGSVIHTGSRGGSFLVIAEMAIVALLSTYRGGLNRGKLLNTGAILVVALLWVAVAAGPDRLIDKVSNSADTFAGRRQFNESSLNMIRDRPLRGFGLGNWAIAYPGYAFFDDDLFANQAHNDWLEWTVEGGIPMLLMMLSVAVWVVPRAIRSGWGLGVAVVLVHCLWDFPIQRTGVAIVFFTMMGAIAPYGRAVREAEEASG